jgi:hypothetical protein
VSFSTTPLRKPLLQSVPTRDKKLGADLFEMLLQYTGVQPVDDPDSVVAPIIDAIKQHRRYFIDEFYMQLVKQTTNNRNAEVLVRTWSLFVIMATVFPARQTYPWVLSHVARTAVDPDDKVNARAIFTFMRLQARHYMNAVNENPPQPLAGVPAQVKSGTSAFGCIIYEIMWCQRKTYPGLPIPYVLHLMVSLLRERGALQTKGLFKVQPPDAATHEILAVVNSDVQAIARGDVHTIGALLRTWLRELCNPLVPVELISAFETNAEKNEFLAFLETVPQTHRLSITYLIGFLQEVVRNGAANRLEKSEVAVIFGPCIVNPERCASGNAQKLQSLGESATAFCSRLIDSLDTRVVYPLREEYLRVGKKPIGSSDKKTSAPS